VELLDAACPVRLRPAAFLPVKKPERFFTKKGYPLETFAPAVDANGPGKDSAETRRDRWFQHQNIFNVIQYYESSFCHEVPTTIGTNQTA